MGKEELKDLVKRLQRDDMVREKVEQRTKGFHQKNQECNRSWFNELCFCLLTANSSAAKGLEIQNYLSRIDGFGQMPQEKLAETLRGMGQRFYQKRSEFIVAARKNKQIKDIVTGFDGEREAREWLVNNIKGRL